MQGERNMAGILHLRASEELEGVDGVFSEAEKLDTLR